MLKQQSTTIPAACGRAHADVAADAEEYWQAKKCEENTGIPAGTWRYWASVQDPTKPASFTLGRRRVWRKSAVLAWIAAQEAATSTGGAA